MKLVLITESLTGGGIARAITTMANHWVEHGRAVVVVTFDAEGLRPHYALRPEVTVEFVDLIRGSRGVLEGLVNNFERIRTIRRVVTENFPDVVIAFGDRANVLALASLVGSGLPVVVAERVDPARHDIGKLWAGLRSLTYRWASSIVVQTSRSAARFPPHIQRRAVVVPNPVPTVPCQHSRGERVGGRYTIVAMGRLNPQKGFDILIESFAKVAPNHSDWDLVIWGEGPERKSLEGLRSRLKLDDRVRMPGVTTRPDRELANADLFVLPSRYEGFPNSLCEAMSAGLAVIATDCDSGPADIVRPNVDGVLVPVEDPAVLASAMSELMDDAGLRQRYGANARTIAERFSVIGIMQMWDEIIASLVRPTNSERSIRVIIGSLRRGGAEIHLTRVLPSLNRRGWAVRVLTLTERGELAPNLEAAGVPVELVCNRKEGQKSPRALLRLKRAVSAIKGLYVEFRRNPRPITWFVLPESYVMGMTAALLATLQGATVMSRRSLNDYQRGYFGVRWLERWYHKRSFLILGNSAAVIRQLRDHEGVPAEKLRLIYGGVDTDGSISNRTRSEVRAELGLCDETFLMVIVASLIPYKGHRDLLEALGIANEELPDDWRLLCVGHRHVVDTGAYAGELEALADREGIGANILWLGQRRDVEDLLEAADLGLLTSHQEGFSNALLEAMAAGLPMIATDVGGNREAIVQGETGYIVAPGSPNALAEAIVELSRDEQKRRQFGERGRLRVQNAFGLETCVDQYHRLFTAVAEGQIPSACDDLTLEPVATVRVEDSR